MVIPSRLVMAFFSTNLTVVESAVRSSGLNKILVSFLLTLQSKGRKVARSGGVAHCQITQACVPSVLFCCSVCCADRAAWPKAGSLPPQGFSS